MPFWEWVLQSHSVKGPKTVSVIPQLAGASLILVHGLSSVSRRSCSTSHPHRCQRAGGLYSSRFKCNIPIIQCYNSRDSTSYYISTSRPCRPFVFSISIWACPRLFRATLGISMNMPQVGRPGLLAYALWCFATVLYRLK